MHISSQLWIFKYFYPHLRKINWNSWNFTFISWRLWKQREDGLCMSRGLYAHLDSIFSSVFLICFFCCFAFLPNIILSSRFSFPQYFIIIIFCLYLYIIVCSYVRWGWWTKSSWWYGSGRLNVGRCGASVSEYILFPFVGYLR